MRMSEFVIREAISADLKANQKDAVIREMVENLRLAGYFKGNESEEVVKAVLGPTELAQALGDEDAVAWHQWPEPWRQRNVRHECVQVTVVDAHQSAAEVADAAEARANKQLFAGITGHSSPRGACCDKNDKMTSMTSIYVT